MNSRHISRLLWALILVSFSSHGASEYQSQYTGQLKGEYKGMSFQSGSTTGYYAYSLDLLNDSASDLNPFSDAGSLAYSELNLSQQYQHTTIHFANAFAEKEQYNQIGFSIGKSRVDLFAGFGEDTTLLRNQLDSIDPYLFHGGSNEKYQYSGLSVNQKITDQLQLSLVQNAITGENLQDRKVQVMAISGQHLDFSYTTVELQDDKVGSAYSLGAVFAGQRISIDYLQQENGASYSGINYSRLNKGITYKLQLQKTENPLFSLKDENRLLFSMSFKLGKGYKPLYATQSQSEDEEQEAEAKKGLNKGLIGGLAVGAGIALSSGGGGGSGDNFARFASQDAAARDVLNTINPVSISLNREHGGYVFRNPDGSFSSTNPLLGDVASILLPPISAIVPSGSRGTASYHTHGGPDPRFDNENFSPADLAADRELGIDGYLGTPGGLFKRHDHRTDAQFVLGTIATE